MARIIVGHHHHHHHPGMIPKSVTVSYQYYHSPVRVSSSNSIISSVLAPSSSASSNNNNNSSSSNSPKVRFIATRRETLQVEQLHRPLLEYMRLPASQYSVLDAERIERVDEDTFRCQVYSFKFMKLEVCPVLMVRVQPHPLGCSINLLSCKLQGSPIVVAQNHKFQASMENTISCEPNDTTSGPQRMTSQATIEVSIDVPFPFKAIPADIIQSSGASVLEQILRIMLPRFMQQLAKDYEAWASGDSSRQPLGSGQI